MSSDAMGRVIDQPEPRGTERLVLLCLANHADAVSWSADVRPSTLARDAALTVQTVHRALANLEEGGFIERDGGNWKLNLS